MEYKKKDSMRKKKLIKYRMDDTDGKYYTSKLGANLQHKKMMKLNC